MVYKVPTIENVREERARVLARILCVTCVWHFGLTLVLVLQYQTALTEHMIVSAVGVRATFLAHMQAHGGVHRNTVAVSYHTPLAVIYRKT